MISSSPFFSSYQWYSAQRPLMNSRNMVTASVQSLTSELDLNLRCISKSRFLFSQYASQSRPASFLFMPLTVTNTVHEWLHGDSQQNWILHEFFEFEFIATELQMKVITTKLLNSCSQPVCPSWSVNWNSRSWKITHDRQRRTFSFPIVRSQRRTALSHRYFSECSHASIGDWSTLH